MTDVTPQSEFASLSAAAQVRRLRAAALEVLPAWPVEVIRLRLLYHGYNTTFRVDTSDGRRFALRLNVNSRKAPEALRAEAAWMCALSEESEVVLPVPQPGVNGELRAEVTVPSLGRTITASLFSWLRGPNLEDHAGPLQLQALGRTLAMLHTHAESWVMPAGAAFPSSNREWGPDFPMLKAAHPLLTTERMAVFGGALDIVRRTMQFVDASGPHHALHADLHLGNAKWYRGQLSIFDFDDCQWGPRAHDLAITTYYIQPRPELVDALFDGYASMRTVPDLSDEHFQALLAARNLLLVDEVLTTESADFQAMLPTYVANSELKLRHFLDTGQYRHELPGVVPLW